MGVAVGRFDLKDATTQFQDRDIECATTQVKHCNALVIVGLVQTIGKSSSCRLVDDALHLQAGDFTRLDGSLALCVAKVGRHGDDCTIDCGSEVVLSSLLHLLQHHSRNLLRGVLTSTNLDSRLVVAVGDYLVGHALNILGHVIHGLAHESLD